MRDSLKRFGPAIQEQQLFAYQVHARSLPPHPCPLPWGEGEPFPALASVELARTSNARATILPLPKGEGRGEGKQRFVIQKMFKNQTASRSAIRRPHTSIPYA